MGAHNAPVFVPMNIQKTTLIFFYICLIGLLFYIAQNLQYRMHSAPYILCTTTIIADTVKNIVGDCVQVKTLMHEDIDPHTYTPTAQDLDIIMHADIIVYNGLHLEARMIDILQQLHTTIPTYAVTQNINHDLLITSQDNPKYPDPHIWFDVSLWEKVSETIYHLISSHYPKHTSVFVQNYKKFTDALHKTDAHIRTLFTHIPQNQRFLVTAHDAFSYFAKQYNFTVISLQGISTQSEAGMSDILHIVKTIVDKKIPTIFIEHSISSKNIEALQEAVREKGHTVHIGQTLYSDALGNIDSPGNTYINMLLHNAHAIANGL
ncbi:manganese transporter [bacterium]|nr:manganese transporter [bacterium]